ncbi:MAG: hypothetical protein J6B72_04585 [Clostridia bacterium]|nr:hypothetical protein [Clostridia bacterium]
MKTKNIAIVLLAAAVLAVAVILILDALDVDMRLSLKKYHTVSLENMQVSFHGSFGKVNTVKIKPDGERTVKLKLDCDAAALETAGAEAVEVCDINGDGARDLLLLTSVDADGDAHRALALSGNDGYTLAEGVDAVNFRMEEGILVAEERLSEVITEDKKDDTAPYEESSIKYEYQYREGSVIIARKTVITYYSDSDIYCFGLWEHNDKYGELTALSEDWLSVEEYGEIKAQIDGVFTVEIPE